MAGCLCDVVSGCGVLIYRYNTESMSLIQLTSREANADLTIGLLPVLIPVKPRLGSLQLNKIITVISRPALADADNTDMLKTRAFYSFYSESDHKKADPV